MGSESSNLDEEMKQRKKRRMISNRESARRSRMRKQKHVNDLVTQLSQLRTENNRVMCSINMTTQEYVKIEAENSVLRAQAAELSHRLESLNEIMEFMERPVVAGSGFPVELYGGDGGGDVNEVGLSYGYGYACQPILASAEMIM